MRQMTQQVLERENVAFQNTGGRSQENSGAGFRPAFQGAEGTVYESRFANGALAPCHLIDGLPTEVRGSVVSGFVRNGQFFTREEAARAVSSQEQMH